MSKRKTTEEFVVSAKAVHRDTYGYDEVAYISSHTPVKILCRVHNEYFYQQPANHITLKRGCPICANIRTTSFTRKSKEEYIERSINKFGDCFDFSKFTLINSKTNSEIGCKLCGKSFNRSFERLFRSSGCPHCTITSGFSPLKPCYYYINSVGSYIIKGGISIDWKERIVSLRKDSKYPVDNLYNIRFKTTTLAHNLEKLIKSKIPRIHSTAGVLGNGFTELFLKSSYLDIIEIIQEYVDSLPEGSVI